MKSKNPKGGIYCIENTINNKKYIGSSNDFIQRKGQHTYQLKNACHYNSHLNSSFQKYGKENFKFSILEYCNDCNDLELKILEQKWVDLFDVTNREKGYNKVKDVVRRSGYKMSDEAKKKMSISKKGKKQSLEVIEARVARRRKVIYQYDINNNFMKEFSCLKEASEATGIDRGTLSKAANPKEKGFITAGGFIWKYGKTDIVKEFTRWGGRPIICNETGEIFQSIKDCSKKMNIDERLISRAVSKRGRISKKFTFSKVEDN